jgi:hypothetical protein
VITTIQDQQIVESKTNRSAHYSALLAINSVVVMVLFIFPSLVRRKRRFPLKIRRHRDPLPAGPKAT